MVSRVGVGGGGGGAEVTSTVTDRVSDAPPPRAVNVYVTVFDGNTCRDPFAGTAPMFWSIEMSVALATDHRSVADWPRSMDRGSAVKLLILGAPVDGGGGSGIFALAVWGGGGG
jgi:hypothetical protein